MSEEKRIILVTCPNCGRQNQLPDSAGHSVSKCTVCNDFFRVDPRLFSENKVKSVSEEESLARDINELIRHRDIDEIVKPQSQDKEVDEEFTPAELEEIELEIKKLVTPLTGKRSPDYDEDLDPDVNPLIPK